MSSVAMNPARDGSEADPGRREAPDGVLVVDKPSGPTSHDMVIGVRRLFRTRRVGHTGTLDPLATGVLPLVLGRATRLAQLLSSGGKTYRATIALGVATDTHDALGTPLASEDVAAIPAAAEIEGALGAFRGRQLQMPPDHSAKKVQGTRAYALARQKQHVALEAVEVDVFRLEVEELDHDRLVVLIECSAGFYVRALARDLGVALGCGAHLTALRRLRSGEFDEAHAMTLEELDERGDARQASVVPMASLVRWLPTAHLGPQGTQRARHGNTISRAHVERWEVPTAAAPRWRAGGRGPRDGSADLSVRLCGPDGDLLGIAWGTTGVADSQPDILQPRIVLV